MHELRKEGGEDGGSTSVPEPCGQRAGGGAGRGELCEQGQVEEEYRAKHDRNVQGALSPVVPAVKGRGNEPFARPQLADAERCPLPRAEQQAADGEQRQQLHGEYEEE